MLLVASVPPEAEERVRSIRLLDIAVRSTSSARRRFDGEAETCEGLPGASRRPSIPTAVAVFCRFSPLRPGVWLPPALRARGAASVTSAADPGAYSAETSPAKGGGAPSEGALAHLLAFDLASEGRSAGDDALGGGPLRCESIKSARAAALGSGSSGRGCFARACRAFLLFTNRRPTTMSSPRLPSSSICAPSARRAKRTS